MTNRLAVAATVICLLLYPQAAYADCYQKLVEVNCATSFDYFSLRTFGSYGLPCPVDRTVNRDGIYDIEQIHEQPLTCALGDQVIEFRIRSYKPALPRGVCGGEEDAAADLFVNGEPILFLRTTHGWCGPRSFNHMIEVEGLNVTHCLIEHEDPTDEIQFNLPPEQRSQARAASCTGYRLERQ